MLSNFGDKLKIVEKIKSIENRLVKVDKINSFYKWVNVICENYTKISQITTFPLKEVIT